MRRPVLPAHRKLPWFLGTGGTVLLAIGVIADDRSLVLIGGLCVAATLVGFVLPHILLGRAESADEPTDSNTDSS